MAISEVVSSVLSRVRSGDADGLIRELEEAGVMFSMDAECVGCAEDYRDVLEEISQFTGGELRIDSFRADEGTQPSLIFVANGKQMRFEVDPETDYLDIDTLLPLLNQVLEADDKRMWYVWDAELYGQDFGIAFVTVEERDALRKHGLPIASGEGAELPLVFPRFATIAHVEFDRGETEAEVLIDELCRLTRGLLQPSKAEVDPSRERMVLELPIYGRIEVPTYDINEREYLLSNNLGTVFDDSFESDPAFAIATAMNNVLKAIDHENEFFLIGESGSSVVFFATPEEGELLRDAYY